MLSRFRRPTLRSRLVSLALLGLALTCSADSAEALYEVNPGEIPGKPGTVIRVWPLEGGGPGGEAFRILYRSTGLRGEPIAVSGAIFLPAGPAPEGGREIIAYAHPTSGVMPKCAPSLRPDTAGMIWGLKEMLQAGYVVAATDYPGLGTNSMHPYLYGVSEARAVLDSVRAARALEHAKASDRYVVWGHSQGGQAALFTGQIARSYAPELKLVGVAAAAPATNLLELFKDDFPREEGKILTAMALLSWSRIKDVSLESVVEPRAMQAFLRTAEQCMESPGAFMALEKLAKPLQTGPFLKIDPTKTEPWRSIMIENTPGKQTIPVPVFLAQGTADTTVDPEVTKQYGATLCGQGVQVHFVEMPGTTHTFAAKNSVSAALQWMEGRFRGAPAPNSCGG